MVSSNCPNVIYCYMHHLLLKSFETPQGVHMEQSTLLRNKCHDEALRVTQRICEK